MLEKVLLTSRYLPLLTVVITLFIAIALYLVTSVTAVLTVLEAVQDPDLSLGATKVLAVSFLKLIDFFFICIGLQIIASGIYKVFVNEDIALPRALAATSFSELKETLVKIASIVLLIDFVEAAVDIGPSGVLMEYGIGIAFVIAAVSWSSYRGSSSGNRAD